MRPKLFITFDQLAQIFSTAETWADVNPDWPDEPIQRFIPGTDSGTFDFFVEEVFDENEEPILSAENLQLSEDDNVLVQGIQGSPYAVGFFGYAYYQENQDTLNVLSIEGVEPTSDSVDQGDYPLARPLFNYTTAEIMQEKPQVMETNIAPTTGVSVADRRRESADLTRRPRIKETVIQGFLFICGAISILTTLGIVYELNNESLSFFTRQLWENANKGLVTDISAETTTLWNPQIGEFGVLPLVNSTLMISVIAMLVALPVGLATAIYLSEYASERAHSTLKPILEVLAGIPTVVYGYFALTFMTPLLRAILGKDTVQIFNTASAGIAVGILIIPLVSSMSEDALHAVPNSLRNAAYALGATKLETSLKVVVPGALSGITAAFVVAISRAIGETMIVAIAAGAGPNFTFNPFASAETMTRQIVPISGGDISYDSIDYNSIFAIGLLLFFITLTLNIVSQRIVRRFREVYE